MPSSFPSASFYLAQTWWLAFDSNKRLQTAATYVLLPGLVAKQITNVAQWWDAAVGLATKRG